MFETVVLIPTYNERENILLVVPEILALHRELHIVVVDDNSPDRTGDAVRDMMKIYPQLSLLHREQKQGIGAAYKHAITHALSLGPIKRIIMMDADGSHDPQYLSVMLAKSTSNDVVLGSRYTDGGGIENWDLWRMLLSRWGNRYARLLVGLPIRDITSGFLCIPVEVARRLDLDAIGASGYAFLMDLKFHLVHDLHANIIEIPILLKSRREGESKISSHIIREGLVTPWRLFARRFYSQKSNMHTNTMPPNITCHICASTDIRHFCEKRGYDLYQCNNCHLTFVYPMPDNLADIYTEEYFKNIDKTESYGYTDYDSDKEPMRPAFQRSIEKIARLTKGRKMFDIGAATGYFLDRAREQGWETQGSEISEYGAREGARRGHAMIYGNLPDMGELPLVDAVTMWDVLEHVPNPRSFCKTVNKMLPKGGIFLVNTPDIDSLWARILGSKWPLLVPPEHVHYYAPKNMKLLLEESGFEIVEISRMGKRFSLPYIFKMLWSWQRLGLWNMLARVSDIIRCCVSSRYQSICVTICS